MADLADKKTLRVLMFVVLFFALFQVHSLLFPFLDFYFSSRSPLMPDSLIEFIAFPLFFLLPLFIGMSFLSLRSIMRNDYNDKVLIALITITILYFIFGSSIYGLIMDYNPYGG